MGWEVYMIELVNRLFVGECVEFMKDMESEIIDLTVTSPPYDNLRNYNGYEFNFENIADQLFRLTKKGGVVVWVVCDGTEKGSETGSSFRQALYFKNIGFFLHDTMIYQKPIRSIGSPNRYYQQFEYMFVFSKGKPKTANLLKDRKNKFTNTGRKTGYRQKDGTISKSFYTGCGEYGRRGNIWYYHNGLNNSTKDKIAFEHPAIFPEKLAEDHIRTWSNEGELVFDPMCGSGTTCKMAIKNNRKYIGVDFSEEYIKIAKERMNQLYLM